MIDFIVGSAVVLAVLFSLVWLLSPGMRNRIERPKFTFVEHANRQDQAAVRSPMPGSGELSSE